MFGGVAVGLGRRVEGGMTLALLWGAVGLWGRGLTVEGVLHEGVLLDDAEHGEECVVQAAGEEEE